MAAPKFSVVIPTRERPGTLASTLRTCLEQDHDDYEIVVCDNCGGPATRQVVDAFASPKIKYVRSPTPLAMSRNWELAIAHAAGEWVTVIGDDDGLLFHAVREWERLTARLPGARAIRWNAVYYSWPTITLPGQGNYLRLPLGRELRRVDARPAIADVIAFKTCYSSLPMCYNALVHRNLIDELRRRTGKIFANQIPDVYTGFALAHIAGTFASVDYPMTVAGTSGGSYGVATLFFRGKSPLDSESRESNLRDGLLVHPRVPDLPIFPVVPVADSFHFARDLLFPSDDGLVMDRKLLTTLCVDGVRAESEEDWRRALDVIRQALADDAALLDWFDGAFKDRRWAPPPPVRLRPETLGFDGKFLHLDAAALGVSDVYGAAQLCDRLLCPEPGGVRYAESQQGPDPLAVLRAQLEEKEAVIQSLAAEVKRQAPEPAPEPARARGLATLPGKFFQAVRTVLRRNEGARSEEGR